MNILEIIFPRYCVNCKKFGEFLCASCFSRLSFDIKNICLVCGNASYNGLTHPKCKKNNSPEGVFTGVVFNKISKKLIYQFKYKPYLSGLSGFLTDLLYESLIQNENFNDLNHQRAVLVPIPLSKAKFKKRGYNQAQILAKELGKKFDLKVLDCLERKKETVTQVGLSKKERRENISGAFSLNSEFIIHNSELKNANIFLVDDVVTTGATFSEACFVLKKAGADKVWAIAFAKED